MSHRPPESFLTDTWSEQACWTLLDTDFGSGQLLLRLWQCGRGHALRPRMLHYVGLLSQQQANALPAVWRQRATDASSTGPERALAMHLAAQCQDLEGGFHRILLDAGTLALTLCVGDTAPMLARQDLQADALLLAPPEAAWDTWQLKALARCCRRGSRLFFDGPTAPSAALLRQAGMALDTPAALPSDEVQAPAGAAGAYLPARYNPHWQLRNTQRHAKRSSRVPGRCAVVGAGLAGASVAHALALRGWQVDVYDAAPRPAAGASGLPLGLVVPHHSADDSPRSRLSRHGTRLMLQHARSLLQPQDWNDGGVWELQSASQAVTDAEDAEPVQPGRTAPRPAATGWPRPMTYDGMPGLWHGHAGWIKPERLVTAWLQHAGIGFQGQAWVHALQRASTQWQLCDAQGLLLGQADCVVLANAHGCVDLLQATARRLAAQADPGFVWLGGALQQVNTLSALHGSLSHGPCLPAQAVDANAAGADGAAPSPVFPPFPVNGHGSFAHGIPSSSGLRWYAGSTFVAEPARHADLAAERAANWHKLQGLLPRAAQALEPQFAPGGLAATWQASRCVTHDRLPLVGPLEEADQPTLWLCAGMGARGLSFSALCAELLAAWLGHEPLPVERNLARLLATGRLLRRATPSI